MIKKTAFTILALTLAVGIAVSQEKGLLQPSMEPTGGWTPAGDLGSKPTAPWTDTTIAAGVDKKPLTGKTITCNSASMATSTPPAARSASTTVSPSAW